MNKTVLGLALGVTGLIVGFFARRVRSLPLGIVFGLAVSLAFAYLVAAQPDGVTGKHYYWEIMLPGGVLGAIVGYATQRYGASSVPATVTR